ncbi:biopolymer transport protein ExbB [Dysgonomonas sp. PH5-45]|uniref:MotA/TolQ/ExbB proton channel family protein n=1 Tax=unclassified Dysgonomonas TaxID=2630389 RepID=UPI00247671A1|nr:MULTISPECIES: MotA/TolQ/ExbB proton channel family protein [unclassified Dysgonomonas]MDH6355740.1 biopolymer transport protein ExbB [Dysgonomonas sp. PH5-45]MDH6388637.1 biopolymer transport protein ExbB [Dysgonomonas sp. PH5-37]
MQNLFVILQDVAATTATAVATAPETTPADQSYFSLLLKGGWILLPIFLLSLLSIYIIIDRWLIVNKMGKKDASWLSRVLELILENKRDKALKFALEKPYASGKVIAAGLKEENTTVEEAEEAMQLEARQQISVMENMMNYLGITASIAPMLGFLGTIFGVINIFYGISQSGNLDIPTISDGLYQKMICSGAGLFVGVIAYAGYYILNSRIDKVVLRIDRESNEALKAIRMARKDAETTNQND